MQGVFIFHPDKQNIQSIIQVLESERSPFVNRSNFSPFFSLISLPRGVVFGGILLAALLAFEISNYSTSDFVLTDLLGPNLKFAGNAGN